MGLESAFNYPNWDELGNIGMDSQGKEFKCILMQ